MRRTRKRSASTDASSIHWTSSTTTVVGPVDPVGTVDTAVTRSASTSPRPGVPGGSVHAELGQDVADRAQRTWRRERVAEPAHDAPAGRGGRRGTKQAGLARSCLAGDGDHLPRPGAVAHRPAEPRELALALQEPHRRRVERSARSPHRHFPRDAGSLANTPGNGRAGTDATVRP